MNEVKKQIAKVNFREISQGEIKFTYNGEKFILEEGDIGVFSCGRCVRLYSLKGTEKKFIKCIGWTRTDNHGTSKSGCFFDRIVTVEECKTGAIQYLYDLFL